MPNCQRARSRTSIRSRCLLTGGFRQVPWSCIERDQGPVTHVSTARNCDYGITKKIVRHAFKQFSTNLKKTIRLDHPLGIPTPPLYRCRGRGECLSCQPLFWLL